MADDNTPKLGLSVPLNTFIFVTFGTISVTGTYTKLEGQEQAMAYNVQFLDTDSNEVKNIACSSETEAALLITSWLILDLDGDDSNEEDDDETPLTRAADRLEKELEGTGFLP